MTFSKFLDSMLQQRCATCWTPWSTFVGTSLPGDSFEKNVFLAIIFLFSLCFLFVLREPVRQVTVLKKVFLAINSYFSFSFLFVFTGTSLPGDSFEKIIFSDKLLFFFFLFVCFAGTSLAGDSFALEKYFWRLIFIFLCTFCLFCGNQFARWQFWIFFFLFF